MTILDEILARTKSELSTRRARVAPSQLRSRPLFDAPRRSFDDALSSTALSVIAEIKTASPSKGIIRADADIEIIATQYAEAGAAAISVLTEPFYFQGDLQRLERTRSAVSVPLLRKDFIIDPYQLIEARAYGADAVLLIATCLERTQLTELLHACEELELDHLVEVYSERDLDRIDFDRVRVLGANSRDLHTFEVDLNRVVSIFAATPNVALRIAESGISTREDLATVINAGADGILVGESLMRAEIPGDALKVLVEHSEELLNAAGAEDES